MLSYLLSQAKVTLHEIILPKTKKVSERLKEVDIDPVKEKAGVVYERAKEVSSLIFDKSKDTASKVFDQTKETATKVYDKTKVVVINAVDRSKALIELKLKARKACPKANALVVFAKTEGKMDDEEMVIHAKDFMGNTVAELHVSIPKSAGISEGETITL